MAGEASVALFPVRENGESLSLAEDTNGPWVPLAYHSQTCPEGRCPFRTAQP
jgi:hypothetical protein